MGTGLQATEFEIGGHYEFIKPQGEDGFAAAFRTVYEGIKDAPDEILFGPLASYTQGPNSATVDTFFVGQVGGNNTIDGLEFDFNWQLKHELNHRVAFGLEGFSAIEDLSHLGSFNQQLHRAGPVIYFDLGGSSEKSVIEIHTDHGRPSSALDVKIAGGLLFGMTDATSDITYKLDAEVAF